MTATSMADRLSLHNPLTSVVAVTHNAIETIRLFYGRSQQLELVLDWESVLEECSIK